MVSTPEIRVDCPDETKFDVVERVARISKDRKTVIDVDGVRVLFRAGLGIAARVEHAAGSGDAF